jgi:hypothetical protein
MCWSRSLFLVYAHLGWPNGIDLGLRVCCSTVSQVRKLMNVRKWVKKKVSHQQQNFCNINILWSVFFTLSLFRQLMCPCRSALIMYSQNNLNTVLDPNGASTTQLCTSSHLLVFYDFVSFYRIVFFSFRFFHYNVIDACNSS